MTRSSRAVMLAAACLVLALAAGPAWGKPVFHPRVRNALGLVPPANSSGKFAAQADVASGAPTPVTYHGGSVMAGGITMHLIFWTGGTNPFQGQPPGAPADYVGMVERLFTDVSHDSGSMANIFSVLPQFAEGTAPGAITPGDYSIAFNAASADDVIMDSDPYPAMADQCASPNDTAICITDGQVQTEVDHIVSTHGNGRGLHDMWFMFLPAGVDECITAGVCGTNAFGAYHSVSDVGHGPTIYAVSIDPIIETSVAPGRGPAGVPGCRGGHGRRCARDGRGDDRPRGHRLDGPQRIRGRRQVRVRSSARQPARVCPGRLAVQPGRQRPRVPVPGDVVKRRQRVRSAHEPDQQPAAAAAGQLHAVQPDGQRQHRVQHCGRRREGHPACGPTRTATRWPSPRRRRPPPPTAPGRCRWPRTPWATIATRSTSTTPTTARRRPAIR